ncbi:hypothetical protein [Methanosarcina sp. KYL-1]|uniref:hypothetical protein n=1 Tax=Methanosarcina sp. KYL-1 TaxID=2602068 RepID=UPI00210159C2|nr:hypothetical protein [Methanosarcina sp. KYL-1]
MVQNTIQNMIQNIVQDTIQVIPQAAAYSDETGKDLLGDLLVFKDRVREKANQSHVYV